ncbi:hypothetical protein B0H13DRAFT_2488347 [Mycena leptocephala]|nr:hypothetical protein B0H13DRAFT_2488347 [Mycena leptocephala]
MASLAISPTELHRLRKDLAILIYELGGGGALYALNKAPIMLPSRDTIADIRRKHSLRITVASGDYLSQDEIAGDGRLCYLDETDEIAGLCEHANSDGASGSRRRVHIGKEFSFAAFSRHAETDYGAKPVLLMPTCKQGTWQSAALVLQKLIQAWKLSPHGEATCDPLLSIASDGDGTRRAALYLVCMHKKLGPDDAIYKFLSED